MSAGEPIQSLVKIPFQEVPKEVPIDPYGPKKGYQSWQATIRRVSLLPASELRKIYGDAINNLEKYGTVTLRELAVLKAFEEVIERPSPSMLNLIMERDEGKVPQMQVSASGNIGDWVEYAKEKGIPLDEVMEEARKIMAEYEEAPTVVEGEIVE